MKRYIEQILEEVKQGAVTVESGATEINGLHEQLMKNFMSEVIDVTRNNLMRCETNLNPLIEKYKLK